MNNKNLSGYVILEDKKHYLVYYLFETVIRLCLSTIDNVSKNPGYKYFCSGWLVSNKVDGNIVNDTNEFMQLSSVSICVFKIFILFLKKYLHYGINF